MRTICMARIGVALALACTGVVAQAQGTNTAWIADGVSQATSTVANAPTFIGSLVSINLNTWTGTQANFAATSGENQTLRGLSAAAGHADGRFHMQGGGLYDWVTEVGPGTSGLNVGDPITVYFDVHVDGSFDTRLDTAAGSSPNYHVNTLAYITLRYSVSDMDLPGYDPESDPGFEFRYGGQATIEAGDVAWSADKVLYQSRHSTATATLQDGTPWEWAGNSSFGSTDHNVPPVAQVAFSVNTGVLRFSFETVVGHHLALNGYSRTEAFGLNDGGLQWQSLVDFANTADAELVSSVPGVEFSGITAGVYQPVPEPGSLLLMLAGVGGLMLRLRARQAA